jgi:hypothetical protein
MSPEMIIARAFTPASLDVTRDYGIKYEISSRYRFLRKTIPPKAYSWATLFLLLALGYDRHTHNKRGI